VKRSAGLLLPRGTQAARTGDVSEKQGKKKEGPLAVIMTTGHVRNSQVTMQSRGGRRAAEGGEFRKRRMNP